MYTYNITNNMSYTKLFKPTVTNTTKRVGIIW
jgi:hypothetical protein